VIGQIILFIFIDKVSNYSFMDVNNKLLKWDSYRKLNGQWLMSFHKNLYFQGWYSNHINGYLLDLRN
jgi:hypothetical protein